MIDHVILNDIKTLRTKGHCLYYYQGNFYYPMDVHGSDVGRIKGAIRKFEKNNAEMVTRDRSSPGYKTKVELFDEQIGEAARNTVLQIH